MSFESSFILYILNCVLIISWFETFLSFRSNLPLISNAKHGLTSWHSSSIKAKIYCILYTTVRTVVYVCLYLLAIIYQLIKSIPLPNTNLRKMYPIGLPEYIWFQIYHVKSICSKSNTLTRRVIFTSFERKGVKFQKIKNENYKKPTLYGSSIFIGKHMRIIFWSCQKKPYIPQNRYYCSGFVTSQTISSLQPGSR